MRGKAAFHLDVGVVSAIRDRTTRRSVLPSAPFSASSFAFQHVANAVPVGHALKDDRDCFSVVTDVYTELDAVPR